MIHFEKAMNHLGAKFDDKFDEEHSDEVFHTIPPTFEEFCNSGDYIPGPVLSKAQLEPFAELGNPHDLFHMDKLITTLVLLWGKSSGKDTVVARIISYLSYVILCMRNPLSYLGLAVDDYFDIVNIAPSADHAKHVFFEKIKVLFELECFAQFRPVIQDVKIVFESSPNFRLMSYHSNNTAYDGHNILAWVIDEASDFKTIGGKDGAREAYRILRTSATSRFVNRWLGFVISYPRRMVDFTVDLYEETLLPRSDHMWGSRRATWECNPTKRREDFAKEYEADHEDSCRIFECIVNVSTDSFFKDSAIIESAIDTDRMPLAETHEIFYNKELEDGSLRSFTGLEFDEWVHSDDAYYVHGDPSISKDAFSLVVGRRSGQRGDDGLIPVAIDLIGVWDPNTGTHVDYLNVGDILLELRRRYRIRRVSFDKQNSENFVQLLQSKAIVADAIGFTKEYQFKIYSLLKRLMVANKLSVVNDDVYLKEARGIIRKGPGKVDHEVGGSKDVLDGIAQIAFTINNRDETVGVQNVQGMFHRPSGVQVLPWDVYVKAKAEQQSKVR